MKVPKKWKKVLKEEVLVSTGKVLIQLLPGRRGGIWIQFEEFRDGKDLGVTKHVHVLNAKKSPALVNILIRLGEQVNDLQRSKR